jgi:chromosome segregation ATPase
LPAELEAQMKAAEARLEPAEAQVISLKEQLGRATSEVEGLVIRGRRMEDEAKRRDLEMEELRKQVFSYATVCVLLLMLWRRRSGVISRWMSYGSCGRT